VSSVRVLVVDDHQVVRTGVRTALADADGIEVVGEATTADEAVSMAAALKPDVVLMDVRLTSDDDLGGVDAARRLLSESQSVRVLMFSSYSERETVLASIMAGASGYLTKNVRHAQLIDAIRATARGESLLDPRVAGLVVKHLRDAQAPAEGPESALSPREQEVLALVAQGMTNRQIAEQLVISEHTARNHVASILDKLGLSSRAAAAAMAARLGI
jgi:two-component system, NarL family, response regulator DevR